MSVIHISGAEAARDFDGVLARVRAGDEIIVDDGKAPLVILSVALEPAGRSIAESISLGKAYAKKLGYTPVMDAEFAADIEERIRARRPRDTSVWD
jgi:antitoxin (DNA-binding transcriptional repressor) of toxin-antitoxin stability system